ncbi:type II toxin-antitoxin system prevent-host-death family antitoxin [Deinococcus soli (ex Cha et al. 2016)]|uniref:type II toxin-antitoxin system prevent-host-death family antitoxin n=1 Tax=Deinococcus soli (ex Cha et al. 2016) TaxID=1309411 RepID=UPI00166AEE37|nr:type II toxin-antitoxin system prevent-host-death family antitoxin [Deinococcus soli (ex Cha et al. 2016)]GGB79464.1 antitoxin [Deinococcus soli (ex Cha et al. 2016)]
MTVSKSVIQVGALRAQLADTLQKVEQGERVMIERHGAPIAALVPVGDYHVLINREDHMAQAKRIIFTNISGGEGKSFFTFNAAFALADMGFRVAIIDGDPQASLTKRLGLHDDPNSVALKAHHTILQVFEQDEGQIQLPEPLKVGNLDVWPANRTLLEADSKISADLSRIGNLHEALIALEDQYDFILLDSKPGVSPLLSAVTAAAEHIIVPVSADKGMENLDELARLLRTAKKFNSKVGIRLFVPNRVRSTNLSRRVMERLTNYSQLAPLSPPVRESTIGGEAEDMRVGVTRFAPKSPLAGDIRQMVDAMLSAIGSEQPSEVSV